MAEEILKYADALFSAALKKCGNPDDAEDLTSETILAALEYQNRGKTIVHEKAWLFSVLNHKWNDLLRRKYRLPTVSIDGIPEDYRKEEETAEEAQRPSAEEVRREVAYLARLQRTVIVKHYFEGKKVETIAEELHIPKGTVLSRLSSGRKQMRKGLETMGKYEKQSYNPERLEMYCHGSSGRHGEPVSLAAGDLLKQNVLLAACQKPLKITDIAKALGIPVPYIESAVQNLVQSELMCRTGEKVFTDFLIVTPGQLLKSLDEQILFADRYGDVIRACIADLLQEMKEKTVAFDLPGAHERRCMENYAILDVFSRGIWKAAGRLVRTEEEFPARPDGGSWIAGGNRYPADFDFSTYCFGKYCYGGERRASIKNFADSREIDFHVYDTQPDLNKYQNGPVEIGDENLCKMLYMIHREMSFEKADFNPMFLEDIPHLAACGVLKYENGRPAAAIPVIGKKEYEVLTKILAVHTEKLADILQEPFRGLFPKIKPEIPRHLEGRIAEFRRYGCYAIPMAVMKKAAERGDFPGKTDGPVPPMLLVCDRQRAREQDF